jgi:hypothetical protein
VLVYHVLFIAIAWVFVTPHALWSLWAHITFVWVPVVVAGLFFFWSSRGFVQSRTWRTVQIVSTSILAPGISIAMLSFVWFILLGKSE